MLVTSPKRIEQAKTTTRNFEPGSILTLQTHLSIIQYEDKSRFLD